MSVKLNKIIKKYIVFCICICTVFLLSACLDSSSIKEDNIKINVVVNSVDNGLLRGINACEWNDAYAYYEDGKIYYYSNSEVEAKVIDCAGVSLMNMDESYIYYTTGGGLKAIDRNDFSHISIDESVSTKGICVYPDEVLVVCDPNDGYRDEIYEIVDMKLIEKNINLFTEEFVSEQGHCANISGYQSAFISFGTLQYDLDGAGAKFLAHNEVQRESYDCMGDGGLTVLSPEHVAVYDDMVYMLLQRSGTIQGYDNNVLYKEKEWDALITFNPKTRKSESIYKTRSRDEQIVGFSVENDELYLLDKGILYKCNLKGENRNELDSYVGSETLTFEYVGDTLFVYKNNKIVGKY